MASRQSTVQITAKYEGVTKNRMGSSKIWIEINRPLRDCNCLFSRPGHYQHES